MYQSTKVIDLGSTAFRQPFAKSHCRFVHGYRLRAKFWFKADELDENGWVVDFGTLKEFKKQLLKTFDHTLIIRRDDPLLEHFKKLNMAGAVDLRVFDEVGMEAFSRYCLIKVNNHLTDIKPFLGKRCVKVEVFDHEFNSAIYTG